MNYLNEFIHNWKNALANKIFKNEVLITLFTWILLLFFLPKILYIVEHRQQHIQMVDYILQRLPSIDLSYYIFAVLYGTIIIASALLIYSNPQHFLFLVQSYLAVQLLRMFTLLLIPLDPPQNLVPLYDPLTQHTIYKGLSYTRDLFFSGHTATIVSIYLIERKMILKHFFLIMSLLLSVLLMIQHIHYTFDIAGGWLAAFFCNYLFVNYKPKLIHYFSYKN